MAATAIVPTNVQRVTGVDLAALLATALDFANGNSFPNSGKQILLVKNPTGAGITVTATVQATGQADKNALNAAGVATPLAAQTRTYVIAAAGQSIIGPFPPSVYNDASNNVQLTYTATGLTGFVVSVTPES